MALDIHRAFVLRLMTTRFGWLITLILAVLCGCDAPCENSIRFDRPSPDGELHAVIFDRSCGATTDFATHVSILPRNQTIARGGNVFVVDSDHGQAPRIPGRGPYLDVSWRDPKVLGIAYDPRVRVFKSATWYDGVTVEYHPVHDIFGQESVERAATP